VAEPAAPQAEVPVAMRPEVEEITAITDEFCAEHLDDEYAQLCRRLTAKLARKRPSPLARGDRLIWAADVVHVIGRAVPHNPGRPTGPTRRTPPRPAGPRPVGFQKSGAAADQP